MYARDPATDELLCAAEWEETARVVELINSGVPVDARQHEAMNALLFAARKGDVPIIQTLLARGASLNPDRCTHCTALTHAIYRATRH